MTTGPSLLVKQAEELLSTLPGVVAARIIADDQGTVGEIHVLTTTEVTPKQTVRNIESALIAHFGMRVDHRKISVATSVDAQKPARPATPAAGTDAVAPAAAGPAIDRRRLYFEDVEVRRSRQRGVSCRVTLRKGEEVFVGEAEGVESDRSRIELSARATLQAICKAEGEHRQLALDGVKIVDAFEREFVFVGITARLGRETALLTGSCEIRDSAETSSALAVLDATNRWIAYTK